MLFVFQWRCFLVTSTLLSVVFLHVSLANAQTPCGNFITETSGTDIFTPIANCANPFGPLQPDESLIITFAGILLEDGGYYPLVGQVGTLVLQSAQSISPFSVALVYKKEGEDYRFIGPSFSPVTFTATGTYAIFFEEIGAPIFSHGLLDTVKSFVIPTAYAAAGDRTLITFEITEPVPEAPVIDPLILQYAPILYFHPDEDYFPMDVNMFVEASSLWSQGGVDTQLYSSSTLTFDVFEDLISSGSDTSDMYLAFSESDISKTVNLTQAKAMYNDIKQDTSTVYYNKMTDSTDHGKIFTVLQYWYFYAMNNWKEKDGFNNHEGDWESVFVFLDEDTKEPEYVAYSSHLNDGDESFNPKQYASVRRTWDSSDVVKDDGRIVSFVSLGSHANYPNNNGGKHNVPSLIGNKIDKTALDGTHLLIDTVGGVDDDGNTWDEYQGKWGTDQVDILDGKSGPLGPRYSTVSGHNRFESPIQWAGIDNIVEKTIIGSTTQVVFPEQEVSIVFDVVIPEGITFEVSPHDEVITFGLVLDGPEILPYFWDLYTTFPENTLSAQLTLPYNLEKIRTLGYTEENLVGAYYDPILNIWTYFPATFNSTTQTATFDIGHFSRYALALVEAVQEGDATILTDSVSEEIERKHLYGSRIVRGDTPTPMVRGATTATSVVNQIQSLVNLVEQIVTQYTEMTFGQKRIAIDVLSKASLILNSQ